MGMLQQFSVASDRVMTTLVAGLEIEFGRGAGEALAARFLAAEASEFCWDARVEEHWLGFYGWSENDENLELDRVQIIGFLDGEWYVATMIVDGEGVAHGMIGKRSFAHEVAARCAFADA